MDWKKLAQAGLSAAMGEVTKKSDDIRDTYRKELRRRSDQEIQNAMRRADEGGLSSWKAELVEDEARRRGL